jgi:DNA-binding MarR family transcriptional regulator
MYQKTLSYYVAMLYRSFSAFTGERLQAVGLNFGLVFFIVYIGKKPNCTPSELTKELALDWGHSQRCVNRLVEDGFITKEKSGRHYLLNLTERGQEAFEAAHRVFFDWDFYDESQREGKRAAAYFTGKSSTGGTASCTKRSIVLSITAVWS